MDKSVPKDLHYHILGHGPHILLAFHGIGQNGLSCFKPFEENLANHYTIYAFDLFFHGKSAEPPESDIFSFNGLITKELWKDILTHFLRKQRITRFDITGFSMGGRFALAALESFSTQIDNAYLIAPDGISEHPLYTFASRFAPARHIFRWSMRQPALLFKVVGTLKKIGLIDDSLHRFARHVLSTAEKRNTVYKAWVAFRQLRFDISSLCEITGSSDVKLYLFIGKYDKLLKGDAVKKMSRLLPLQNFIVLRSGHSKLVEKVSLYVRQMHQPENN